LKQLKIKKRKFWKEIGICIICREKFTKTHKLLLKCPKHNNTSRKRIDNI